VKGMGYYIYADVPIVLLSETHLKPRERFFIPNYHFYRTESFQGRKGIPHDHVKVKAIPVTGRGGP
jgi:hypothetical protein